MDAEEDQVEAPSTPADFLSPEEWDNVRRAIAAMGPLPDDMKVPPVNGGRMASGLGERVRRWCYAYVKSGGSIHVANKEAEYSTGAAQTAARILANQAARVFIASLFAKAFPRLQARQQLQQTLVASDAADRIEEMKQAFPEDSPSRVLDAIAGLGEVLKQATEAMRNSRPGLYRRQTGNKGDWVWDLDKIEAAPAGVIKQIRRDKTGEIEPVFGDVSEFWKQITDFELARNGVGKDADRANSKTLIINILNADPSKRLQLDELSKDVSKQLREALEEEKRLSARKVIDVDSVPSP